MPPFKRFNRWMIDGLAEFIHDGDVDNEFRKGS